MVYFSCFLLGCGDGGGLLRLQNIPALRRAQEDPRPPTQKVVQGPVLDASYMLPKSHAPGTLFEASIGLGFGF